MANATNIAVRAYNTNYVSGESIEATDWKTSGYLNTGCNPNYNHNRVVVIRFTLEKFAKTVTIPIQSGSTNGSSAEKPLCYGLGNDPEVDDSMTNASGDANALGTFYFRGTYAAQEITLHNVEAGTKYLYIWGRNADDYSLTNIDASVTCSGITYEELEGLTYLGNGSEYVPYMCYIGNGESWVHVVPYCGNGTEYELCN